MILSVFLASSSQSYETQNTLLSTVHNLLFEIGHPIPFCKVLMLDSHTYTQILVDNPSPPNSPGK